MSDDVLFSPLAPDQFIRVLARIGGWKPQRRVKRGQIWQMGQHRLMCGDARDAGDMARLMDGAKANMTFTSPPYADLRTYLTWDGDFDGLVHGVFSILPDFMSSNGQVLVNVGNKIRDGEIVPYYNKWAEWMIKENGYRLFDRYIWDKQSPRPGCSHRLMRAYEDILHFHRVKRMPNLTVQKKPETIKSNKEAYTGRRLTDGRMKPAVKVRRASAKLPHPTLRLSDSVFRIPRDFAAGIRNQHPAIFPVKLAQAMIEIWSDVGDAVLEPFCGSGTMIIAAENCGRKCFAMEIEPEYVELSLNVWEDRTGIVPLLK